VRPRFSVLLGYSSLVIRFVSSLLFSIIVVRSLSPQDFSVWVFGFSILPILSIGYDLWGWAYARRHVLGVRSSLFSGAILNIFYAIISSIIMFILTIFISMYLGSQYLSLIFFVVNVSTNALSSYASYVTSVLRPDISASSSMVFEIMRVLIAYIMIRVLNTGLGGAIISPAIASVISSTYSLYMLKRSGLLIFSRQDLLREISILLKMSLAGLVNSIGSFLWNSDRIFLTIISRAEEAVSFLGISYSLRGILSQITSTPSSVIYAKLLEESKSPTKDLLMITFSFSIPSLFIMIVMSKSFISILNPYYISISDIISISLLDGFISGIAGVFVSIALGVERRDLYIESAKDLFKTSIGRIYLANLTRAGIFSISSLIYSLLIYKKILSGSPEETVLIISLLLLIPSISYLIFTFREAVEKRSIEISRKDLFDITLSSIISSLYLVMSGANNLIIRSVWKDLSILLFHLGVSAIIYIISLYILSKWFRDFIKTILRYLFSHISSHRSLQA